MSESLAASSKLSFIENFLLSGAAAVASKTVAAPIERVKLLVQNESEMIKSGRLEKSYGGVWNCTMHTMKHEGLGSFWRGNTANVVRYFPTQALNFAFKDTIKEMFATKKDESTFSKLCKNIGAGGAAGALSLAFVYSLDFARTRLASDVKSKTGTRQYDGLIDVYRKTLSTDGIQGLYRGFVISCVGIMVYRGFYFGLYDTLRPILLGKDASVFFSFCLAYGVTVASGLLSYPLDTIRRRMMMTVGTASKYKNSLDCGIQILKQDGAGAFMRGAGANILRGVAGAGVLAGFDAFQKWYIANFKN